ncbi:MAG: LicD family protein [Deltaproteobacteria bacterium]
MGKIHQKRSKILIFGAGGGGMFFYEKYQDKYAVLAFIDNDSNKQGEEVFGVPIIGPKNISEYNFDKIFIVSMWSEEIERQLRNEFEISPEKIVNLPKSKFKNGASYPFEDPATLEFAGDILLFLTDMFEREKVPYFIDHGTLLGIVRDGDIISWDDDIDISVPARDSDRTILLVKERINSFSATEDINWSGELLYDDVDGDLGLRLFFKENGALRLNDFVIGISFIHFKNGVAEEYINVAPVKHFAAFQTINYKGRDLRIPQDTESYLELHYGDWKSPKRDFSFSDIKNFKNPNAAIRKKRIF